MGNYLKMPDKRRVLALLELGWSYRRIERETGVRRETVASLRNLQQPLALPLVPCLAKQVTSDHGHVAQYYLDCRSINAILPGPTDTPLARANADIWLAYASNYRAAVGVTHLQPKEMGDALIYLCSPMASGVTGENIFVDSGFNTVGL